MEVACHSFDASYLIEHVNGAIFAMSHPQVDINMVSEESMPDMR